MGADVGVFMVAKVMSIHRNSIVVVVVVVVVVVRTVYTSNDGLYIGAPMYGCRGTLRWAPTWVFLRLPRCRRMANVYTLPL